MKFYWFKVYGLGASFEVLHLIDDMTHGRYVVSGKVFLGPLLILFGFNVWRYTMDGATPPPAKDEVKP